LRRSNPDLRRGFRVPFVRVLSPFTVLASLYLIYKLPSETWLRFVIWLVIGLVVYFGYGRRHSRLEREA